MEKNKKISLVLNILVILSSSLGLFYTLKGNGEFMTTSALYYYTIQSNIFILLIMIIFIVFDIFKIRKSNTIFIIKYIITVGISITFLVFLFMLTPQMIINNMGSYLLTISNITLHFTSPLLSIVSFVLCDSIIITRKKEYLCILMPLYYLIFSFTVAFINKNGIYKNFDGTLSKFPYFFLDYETNGWFTINNGFFGLGTIYWILIISILTILIGKMLLKLNLSNRHYSKV